MDLYENTYYMNPYILAITRTFFREAEPEVLCALAVPRKSDSEHCNVSKLNAVSER